MIAFLSNGRCHLVDPSSSSSENEHEREVNAVAALVKLLVDSGFQPHRIEAALRKPTTAANADRHADCYAAAVPRDKRRRDRAA
ncbi:hypothetical protein [Aureimonas sp. Leaf454]|uniref:hypothetical protein n=1 Tax=Aureimonas sp. Leaf454 TaxID=1736381 RepID=UPI000A538170|nr:hypothetical protein [Aureimonas sp. Leaf454]